ncbi:MAG TPA: efflux RND transporter periplasmic adaptor subunit, partial [Terriglobales bacterium]|nr:efflux RND transporter periplasmic adaptor subunit [Terriglobales bacterium]
MRTIRAFRALTLLAAIAIANVTTACRSRGDPSAHAEGPQAMPVRVQIARNIPVDETTEYVATLKSRNSAVIMPQVEGHIRQIYVHSGDRVETGTPLLEIDPLKQEATVTSQRS